MNELINLNVKKIQLSRNGPYGFQLRKIMMELIFSLLYIPLSFPRALTPPSFLFSSPLPETPFFSPCELTHFLSLTFRHFPVSLLSRLFLPTGERTLPLFDFFTLSCTSHYPSSNPFFFLSLLLLSRYHWRS
jgi:hypothetical protein